MRLEPLDLERHWPGLLAIGLDPDLWRWTVARITGAEDLRRYLEQAAADMARGAALPYAVRHLASDTIAGCTRFGNLEPAHRRAEIGWTWVGRPFQRTAVNTEQKLLMFTHAFETWALNRVELKTSHLNLRSQAAMRRLGLVEEGTLRRHTVNEDGVVRDTVYFSVIRDEWPALRERLTHMLARD